MFFTVKKDFLLSKESIRLITYITRVRYSVSSFHTLVSTWREGCFMSYDHKPLHQLAQEIPWALFTGEEIAVLCRVSQNVVTRVKSKPDSPFRLNKCRPEWFAEWMRNHPEFQLTKTGPTKLSTQQNVKSKMGHFTRTTILLQEVSRRLKERRKRPGDQKP